MKVVILLTAVGLGVVLLAISGNLKAGRSVARTLLLIVSGNSAIVILVGVAFSDYTFVSWSHSVTMIVVLIILYSTKRVVSMPRLFPFIVAVMPSLLLYVLLEHGPRFSASMTNKGELDLVIANAIGNPLTILIAVLAYSLMTVVVLDSCQFALLPKKVYSSSSVIIVLLVMADLSWYSYVSSRTTPHGSFSMWAIFNLEHLCALLIVIGATGTSSAMILAAARNLPGR